MMQCYDTVTPCEPVPVTPPLRRSRRSSWPPLVTPGPGDIGCEAVRGRGLVSGVTPGARPRITSDSVSEVGPALSHHITRVRAQIVTNDPFMT